MRKQYQKTCPLCGQKIVVEHIADFGKHECAKKRIEKKPVEITDEKPVERKRKKWQDDNV